MASNISKVAVSFFIVVLAILVGACVSLYLITRPTEPLTAEELRAALEKVDDSNNDDAAALANEFSPFPKLTFPGDTEISGYEVTVEPEIRPRNESELFSESSEVTLFILEMSEQEIVTAFEQQLSSQGFEVEKEENSFESSRDTRLKVENLFSDYQSSELRIRISDSSFVEIVSTVVDDKTKIDTRRMSEWFTEVTPVPLGGTFESGGGWRSITDSTTLHARLAYQQDAKTVEENLTEVLAQEGYEVQVQATEDARELLASKEGQPEITYRLSDLLVKTETWLYIDAEY